MKKRASIVVAILLLAVGFAAISTTLIINGSTSIGENADDFSVIFTAASIDGKDVYNSVIDDTKKIITFETSELKTLNQTSVLAYEVTNNSANYDAEIKVTCVPKDGTTAKYTSIKNELANNATVIKAKETLNGTLIVTLDKTSTEEVSEEYTCTLEFNAVERDTLGAKLLTAWIPTYFEYGEPTIASTTDYTEINRNVFVGLDSNNIKGICINDNGLLCMKANDYDNTRELLKNHFGESNCNLNIDNGSRFRCETDAFDCYADPDGYLHCDDYSDAGTGYCSLDSNGIVSCD